jgi:hypothetical protein
MSIHGTAISPRPRGRQIDYEHLFACRKSGKPHAQVIMARDQLRRKTGVTQGTAGFAPSVRIISGQQWSDPYELQQIPVHANPKVMQRCAHLSTESLQDMAVCNTSKSVVI